MEYRTFSYEPLQPRQIRVLQFTPSPHPSNIISARCIHMTLDHQSQNYVAVSYAWGSMQKSCQMLLNGRILNITENVHNVFRSKITDDPNTRVWIDAVCINQEDLVEKASQVRLMGEVYSNAENTRIWIGLASSSSDLAIHFIKTLFSILPELETGDPERINHYYAIYPSHCPEWTALAHFLNRPWFARTWVIQEVVLATHASIVCGEAILTWDILDRVMVGLHELGIDGLIDATTNYDSGFSLVILAPPGLPTVIGLSILRKRVRDKKPRPILRVMAMFRNSLTTEENDKIFAMLGVATDVADPIFYPDYTKPSGTLFRDITKFLMKRDASLDALRYAGLDKGPRALSVPSWAVRSFLSVGSSSHLGNFSVTTSNQPNFLFSDSSDCLRLRAFIFDKVCRLGSMCVAYKDGQILGEDETSHYFEWFLQAKWIAQSTTLSEEVFWRTLLANRVTSTKDVSFDGLDQPPDQSWGKDFKAFEPFFALSLRSSPEEGRQLLASHEGLKAMKFRGQMSRAIGRRRFGVLSSGSLGLMPHEAQVGDLVAAFLGAKVLFVIRPLPAVKDEVTQYQLVGECYVHDRMDGQVMDLGLEIRDIVLI